MTKILKNNISPIAVGALGGSGTRVVAEILMQAGVYMGDNLNDAKDNLTFTCLFKRPDWYNRSSLTDRLAKIYLFERMMKGETLSLEDCMAYAKAYWTNWNYTLKNKVKAPFRGGGNKTYIGWGWKEPNTHLFLKELNEVFPNLRYVHVVRNGLDMAFSSNVQQLKNWGDRYGVSLPEDSGELPAAQLDYWIKANNEAISLARNILKDRFYLLKFEDLCFHPEESIKTLFRFLKIEITPAIVKELAMLPQLPSSTGRYREADISIFTEKQLRAVDALGYQVESQEKAKAIEE